MNGVPEDASSKKPTKKKKVSFKFGLETSDDAHIVKKEPNSTFDPPVSIIKKTNRKFEDGLLKPSSLDVVTQIFNWDKSFLRKNVHKLDSLPIKSQWVKSKETTSEDTNVTSNEEDQSDVDYENDKQKLDTDLCGESDSDGCSRVKSDESGSMHNGDNAKGDAFQLPKRSAHSSRVIKPNKRFTDDCKSTNNKNGFGKKKNSKLENALDPLEATKNEGKCKFCYEQKKTFFKSKFLHFQYQTPTDDDNVLKIADHIKNNPFAKMNDDLVFGSSSKSILRQSRLQFASVLQPATAIANSSRAAATNTESLFSSNLSNLSSSCLNRNAIPCEHPTHLNTSFQFY